MRNSIEVVAIVVGISILYVLIVILQFDEDERQTIHEANDISPTLMDWAFYPQLPYGNKLVVIDIDKVYDTGTHLLRLSIGLQASNWHTITQILVLLFVYLHQRLRTHVARHALNGFRQLLVRHPRVETFQSHAQMSSEHDLVLTLSS